MHLSSWIPIRLLRHLVLGYSNEDFVGCSNNAFFQNVILWFIQLFSMEFRDIPLLSLFQTHNPEKKELTTIKIFKIEWFKGTEDSSCEVRSVTQYFARYYWGFHNVRLKIGLSKRLKAFEQPTKSSFQYPNTKCLKSLIRIHGGNCMESIKIKETAHLERKINREPVQERQI